MNISEHQFKNIISVIFLVFALFVINHQASSNIQYSSITKPVPLVSPLVSVEPRISKDLQNSDEKIIARFEDLDMPKDFTDPKSFDKLFTQVAKITGVDKKILYKFAAIESRFNPNAVSKIGAKGLFQFTDDTWKFNLKHFGARYGITVNDVFDPRANALIQGFHVQSIIKLIKDKTDLTRVTTRDIYLAHLLGRTGFLRFHKMQSNTIVANKMPKAAKFNKPFFYQGKKALNQSEVKIVIESHIANKIIEFGLIA